MPRPGASVPDDPILDDAFDEARARLALNLRRLRGALRLSQARVAERAGLSLVYLGSLEGGRRIENPSLRALSALAHALDCNIGDIVDPPTRTTVRKARPKVASVRGAGPSGARRRR